MNCLLLNKDRNFLRFNILKSHLLNENELLQQINKINTLSAYEDDENVFYMGTKVLHAYKPIMPKKDKGEKGCAHGGEKGGKEGEEERRKRKGKKRQKWEEGKEGGKKAKVQDSF